jgi:4-amino-4-deoxy-L-arabinose transferase-like glycosyltransferase
MRLSQNRFRELLLLTVLCGFFFFFRLSGIGLLGPDEPRYAQVAREMLAHHDWITPVLYGHNWLEKPILLYWGEMLSYGIFGVSDWAARIPSAVAATLLVFGTFFTVRRIRYEARLDAALMIASSVLVLGFARAAATDMLLAAPWSLSLLAWFCWYQSSFESSSVKSSPGPAVRFWLVLFYALNALAMLAKGPVAPVLAALVLIVFCAAQRNSRALLRTLDPIGIAVFFAVAAPWYALVQLRTPEFFRVFFLQHNLARFGSNLYRHKQPFWYYVPVALVATLPWTVWMIHGLADGLRALRSQLSGVIQPNPRPLALSIPDQAKSASSTIETENVLEEVEEEPQRPAPAFTFEIFLLLWALIPIAFFSLSHSKLPGYILPSVPALLILSSLAVHRRAASDEGPSWVAIVIHAILLAAIVGALCVAPRLALKLPASFSSMGMAAIVGTVIFLVVALPLLTAGWRMLRFVTLFPLILAVGFLLRGLAPAVDATQSSRPIAELLQEMDQPGNLPLTTFSLNRNMAFGLSFYLDRRVAPYEGLEISPAVYELPAAIPNSAHILVTRQAALPALRLLLSGRSVRLLGSYSPQSIDIYQISSAP